MHNIIVAIHNNQVTSDSHFQTVGEGELTRLLA